MIPGFIGTGAITEAMVAGLCTVGGLKDKVVVSTRSEVRSARLAEQFSNVEVLADNQAIVDCCDVVIVALLPQQASSVLPDLHFRAGQQVLSVIAGLQLDALRDLVAPATGVYRGIPMPPVEYGLGPFPVCPPAPALVSLLEGIGTVVPVTDEHQFQALAGGSALMAAFYEFTATTARWIEGQGVPTREAALYSSSMLHALAHMTTRVDAGQLQAMSEECLTAGGLNEQVLFELRDHEWFGHVGHALDGIMRKLDQV